MTDHFDEAYRYPIKCGQPAPRLLTAEQVAAIMHLHELCDNESHQDRERHCRYCGGDNWPCEIQQLADHIAAQAGQVLALTAERDRL